MSYLSILKKIDDTKTENDELIKYLDVPNISVIGKVIFKIIERKFYNDKIVDKLCYYSKFRDDKYKLIGPYKLGHLAISALLLLGNKEKYEEIYNGLNDLDKELVKMMINSI